MWRRKIIRFNKNFGNFAKVFHHLLSNIHPMFYEKVHFHQIQSHDHPISHKIIHPDAYPRSVP